MNVDKAPPETPPVPAKKVEAAPVQPTATPKAGEAAKVGAAPVQPTETPKAGEAAKPGSKIANNAADSANQVVDNVANDGSKLVKNAGGAAGKIVDAAKDGLPGGYGRYCRGVSGEVRFTSDEAIPLGMELYFASWNGQAYEAITPNETPAMPNQ